MSVRGRGLLQRLWWGYVGIDVSNFPSAGFPVIQKNVL